MTTADALCSDGVSLRAHDTLLVRQREHRSALLA